MGERNENNVEYTNQKEIDALNEKLKKIDENLKLGRFGVNESNKAINAGLTIAGKGKQEENRCFKRYWIQNCRSIQGTRCVRNMV